MSPTPETHRRRDKVRQYMGGKLIKGFFEGLSGAGRMLPMAHPKRHGVDVIKNLPYRETGMKEHLLDIYRPAGTREPLPVVLYIHGGGFRILSKDTHWVFALGLAKLGFLVVNINYRLAPQYPYPAAVEDSAAAYQWVLRQVEMFGGDPNQISVAGESAGANLATCLTLASCYASEPAWAQEVFAMNVVPKSCSALCGMMQVSDVDRLVKPSTAQIYVDRVHEISDAYLRPDRPEATPEYLRFGDPLCILEEGNAPDRPLPPFFASVGRADILLEDTRRLKRALDALDVRCDAPEYDGEPHAFQALVFRKNSRAAWKAWSTFYREVLGDDALVPARPQ